MFINNKVTRRIFMIIIVTQSVFYPTPHSRLKYICMRPLSFVILCCIFLLSGCQLVWHEDENLKVRLKLYFDEAVKKNQSMIDLKAASDLEIVKVCYQGEYTDDTYIEKNMGNKIIISPDLSISKYAVWVKYKNGKIGYAIFFYGEPFNFKGGELCSENNFPRLFITKDSDFIYFHFRLDNNYGFNIFGRYLV